MARFANMWRDIPEFARFRRSLFISANGCPILLLLSLILLGLAASGCSTSRSYVSRKTLPDFVCEDFAQRRTNLARVALMPPQLDILRQRFWREGPARSRETNAVSLKLQQLVAAQLESAGFTVQPAPTNSPASADDRKDLDQWTTYAAWTDPPADLASAKIFAEAAHADALVCVQFSSTKTTWQRHLRDYHATAASWVGAAAGAGGVLAAIYFSHAQGVGGEGIGGLVVLGGVGGYFLFKETAWLITGGGDLDDDPLPNRAVLHVALVDGRTGWVLWSDSVTVESGPKYLESMVAGVFQSFPR